ncbi:MAG: translocation/assembly module TamB domain-containing protein, partial [Spirochaetes bacterium]|nr:translocation/assembly module TamB domain-containing protein [Spirochaetota bacterium]
MYKLFKLNYQEDARISGDLNLKLNKSFFNVNNRLEIDFKNNKEIKKVYLNSTVMKDHLNINYKVVLKNNKLVIIRGRSINNNSISGIIDYDKIERKFVLNYKEDRNKYFFQLLFDKMDLQVKYFNNYDFSAILKVNRIIDEDFKTRLIVNAFAKGNFKKIKNIYLKGDMKIRNLLQSGSSTFSFKKVKNKIRFNDIQIKLDRNLWTGAGYYNLNDQKVNIAMNKMNIKGAYKKGVFNLYVFFKKNKNFYYQSAIFNVNGFLNIKYSLNLFRTYGDMNIYNFKYKELKIPETYAVFIYQNNNFSFKKLNFDYNKGKIYCNIKSLYKENNMYCGEAVLVARNVDFDANKISTKLYSKFCLGDAIDLKLKILYLAFNDLEIDDIDEEIYFHKNKMKITKINNNGITGYINFFKNRMDLDLALDLENSHIKFYGKKVEKKINYNFILDNFNLEFFEEALPLIKKAEGRISSKLSFTGSSDNPLVNGSITGHNLYLKFYDMIKKVTDLDLGVNINNNLIRIMQCKGFIGKGEFSLLGDVLLEKLKIVNLDLVLKTLGKRGLFIERSKNDLIGEVITDLQIKGNPEKIGIGGTLTANNFDFTWPLSENDKKDNDFFKDTVIDFNIDIIAGKNVRFFQDVNGMDILVKEGGKYHLRGDLSRKHKVVGRMEAEKGTMDYFGTTFNIIHANVDFSSHYHENVPWISAKAEAESKLGEENYIITMVVDGRAYNNLTPQLTSTPSLTQREIFLLFNDSTLYVSDRVQDEVEEEKEINRLIKTGFIQIFYSTYRSKLVTPIERKARRFLGLDLLKIKTSLVEKLLEPKLYKVEDHEDKSVNPLVDTQLSVGKYVTENLLLKYSVILKEEIDFANLYYEQKVGFEWRIFSSLN